jgi:DNA-binding XRE family transcriptional regulator
MRKSGIEWTEALEKELYTPEEIEENNLQAKLLCELIDARQARGISQRDLEELCGITQSAIARMERGASSPTLDTLFKVLVPLGKTLAIVPIPSDQ